MKLAYTGPSQATLLSGTYDSSDPDNNPISYSFRAPGLGHFTGVVTYASGAPHAGYPRVVQSNQDGTETITTVLTVNSAGDYPIDMDLLLPYVQVDLDVAVTLAAEVRYGGLLRALSQASSSLGVNFQGVVLSVISGTATVVGDGLLDTECVVLSPAGGAVAAEVTLLKGRRRIPDSFLAWGAGIGLTYALDSLGAGGQSISLTLYAKDASGAVVASKTVGPFAGNVSQATLQTDLVIDMSASGLGAGDDLELELTVTKDAAFSADVYLGELSFDWS